MMMGRNIFLYDGTFDGMLTAVACGVKGQHRPRGIYERCHYVPQLLDQLDKPKEVATDGEQARRLFVFLQGKGHMASRYALNSYLSEDVEAANYLLDMVLQILHKGVPVLQCYTDGTIRHLDRISRKVAGEAHRLNGLIRFRKLKGDILYGPFEPEFNVIGYCGNHFIGRLRNKRWILHDMKRNIAILWDRKRLAPIQVDGTFSEQVVRDGEIPENWIDDEELFYQELWRIFHGAISNESRENRPLQRQCMPVRYWKYLVEMA